MGQFVDWVKKTFIGGEDEEGYEEGLENDRKISIADDSDYRKVSSHEKRGNVVSINQTVQLEVVLEKPDTYEQATEIARNINDKKAVVLNLESTNKEVARRILDFLTGVTFANEGKVQRVSNSTYLITPRNVGMTGEMVGELENNGYIS